MKRRWVILCGFGLFLSLACAAVAAEGDKLAPPAPSGTTEMNWTRRPVLFSHDAHFKAMNIAADDAASCATCHHPVNGEIPYKSCASSGCHDNMRMKATGTDAYFQAMHKKEKERYDSCVSCHTRAAGPDPEKLKLLTGCRSSICHP